MARFTQVAGGTGSALNYVQNKVSSPVPVTGWPTVIASLDITTTGKPVQISVTGEGANNQPGSWVRLNIFRDEQPIGNEIQIEASAVSENVPYAINVIDEVGAGVHTYQAIITSMSAGTWSFGEASGPIINAVELTGFKGDTGPQGPQGIQGEPGSGANIGNFIFNGDAVTTNGDMSIGVMGVPGSVSLSAYNGVNLSFAQTEGAGLRFPDNTVQTTAYTGGTESPKNWTAESGGLYSIRQAHGGVEVSLPQPSSFGETVTVVNSVTNSSTMTVTTSSELSTIFSNIWTSVEYFRKLAIDFNGQTRYFRVGNPTSNENEWVLEALDGPLTTYGANSYYINLEYGGAPTVWWDADNLGLVDPSDAWQFRGAKIEYHAYSTDSGTIIGTIYIASDNGDNNVTHIETNSGVNDSGAVILWNRYGNERQVFAYRADNEDDTVKIHWTAQVYYGTEYYD